MKNVSPKTQSILATITSEQWSALAEFAGSMAKNTNVIAVSTDEVRTPVEAAPHKEELYARVTKLIHNMGVPAHIKGYQYLRDAVILVYNDRSYIESVTKCLYPDVAEKHETTPSRVERAIRHAIELADEEFIKCHLIPSLKNGKPTNSELIASVVEYLKLRA